MKTTTQTEPQDTRECDRMISRQRMMERAVNLFRDGYTIMAVTATSNAHVTRPVLGRFIVCNPRGAAYAVDVLAQSCECVCWRRNGACKHIAGAVRLAEQHGYDLTRRNALGTRRYAEGRLLIGAVTDCRRVAEVVAAKAAAERRRAA